jgi:hypothetical protein
MVAISNIRKKITQSKSTIQIDRPNYKFIDLPKIDEISNIIMQYLPEDIKKYTVFKSLPEKQFALCKPLVEAVETIKPWSDIYYIALITVAPFDKLPTHIDWDMKDKPYSLNIPIYNCSKTPSIFYRLKDKNDKPKVIYQDHGDPFYYYDGDQTEEIERFYLTKAAFFNTQIPHSALNTTNEARIMISVRFKTPLEF